MPTLHLRLSDLPQVDRDTAPPLPLAARDAALLAWLAVEGPTRRERLAALLWPTSSDAQARTTLRQRLFQLKKQLGRDLALGSPTLQLAEGVSHDLAESTELLGGLSLPDAPELDAWLCRQREQRQGRETDNLRAQAQAQEDAGDATAALPVALALLRQEPLSEAAHRRAMRLHYLLGDRAAALRAFDACERMLKDEVGARPSAETLALLATVERAGAVVTAPGVRPPRQLPAAAQRPPALVGRAAELQALERAWQGGQVAAVVGEAGIGKSRLLAEFMSARPGLLRSAGRPGDEGVPYATLARLLRAVGEHGGAGLVDAETRHQLARVLPELAREGVAFRDEPMQAFQRAIETWLRAPRALAGLVWDDLHFADAASLEMLHALLHSPVLPPAGGGLRWLLAYRPTEAEGPLLALQAALTESARLAPVKLRPLDKGALAALVDQLELGWAGERVAAALWQRTGGNPLFVLETLRQAWVSQSEDWPTPASVERLLDRRVARLTPPALALARVVCLAGVDFAVDLAEAVLGTSAMHLADALNELETAQVLRGMHFTHDLVFDAVRRSLPQLIAEHGHAQVAAWLERRDGEPARIAGHWLAAAQPARALPWLGHAAQRALRLYRNVEALAFLEHKARIEADGGQREQAFATQVEAVALSLDTDLVEERAAQRCARLDDWAGSAAQRCEARLMRASVAFRRYESAALPQLQEVLREATALGEVRLAMECRVLLTLAASRVGQLAEALVHGQSCLGWIEAHGSLFRRGELHTYLAQLQARSGSIADALAHHAAALRIADELGTPHHQASVRDHLASTLWIAGRAREALPYVDAALAISTRHSGPPANMGVQKTHLAQTLQRLGRYREALQALESAESALATFIPLEIANLDLLRGVCWAELGQWARLQAIVARADAWPPADPLVVARFHRLAWLLGQGQGHARADRLDLALALTPPQDFRDTSLLQIHRASGLPAVQALPQLDALRDDLARRGYDGHVLTAHIVSAQLAAAADPALARGHALQALALAGQRDVVGLYRGELYLQCARALHAAGDAAHAARVAREGCDWVLATAHGQVPEAFRESFLHRNPTNVALAALPAQLEASKRPRAPHLTRSRR